MPNLKLVVEVCHAMGLGLPQKEGSGPVSVSVEASFDSQKQRTKSKANDSNPVWNERLEFNVSDEYLLGEEPVIVGVYMERKGKSRQLLGKAKVEKQNMYKRGSSGAETAIGYSLKAWNVIPFGKGEVYLKVYYYDEDGSGSYFLNEVSKTKDASIVGESGPATARSVSRNGLESAATVSDSKRILGSDGLPIDGRSMSSLDANVGGWNIVDGPAESSPSGASPAVDPYFEVKPTKIPGSASVSASASASGRRYDSIINNNSNNKLVAEMTYLFVRIDKARGLAARDATGSSDPFVEVKVGNEVANTKVVPQSLDPVWNEVFAIARERSGANFVEITVWDKDAIGKDFLGFVGLEIGEIPERRPPDAPLAAQWHKLGPRGEQYKTAKGEIMLSAWVGTQGDEAFAHARHSDSGWESQTRSKVYLSPRLWYLRVVVHEAQDLVLPRDNQLPDSVVHVELVPGSGSSSSSGPMQRHRTRPASFGRRSSSSGPSWKEEFILVAAEPFSPDDLLHVSVVEHMSVGNRDGEVMGFVKIPLPSIAKRSDSTPQRSPSSMNNHLQMQTQMQMQMQMPPFSDPRPRWYDLERDLKDLKDVAQGVADKIKGTRKSVSRILLTLCLEGGYHVLDESSLYTSNTLPTDKSLYWIASPMAMLEIGLLGASGLVSTTANKARGSSVVDAYCVAKYGNKWVRTRTVLDSPDPQWNEQYTWEVYDPCTVLTIGVFDNNQVGQAAGCNGGGEKASDEIIGKVRIRLSTLETNRTYSHRYPLLVLDKTGLKKRGELDVVVRMTCVSRLDMMQVYTRPLLPPMHYQRPLLNGRSQEKLREVAMRLVAARLERSEPPVRPEVVRFMLDADSSRWSWRRSGAHQRRLSRALAAAASAASWLRDVARWRNPFTTLLVLALYVILVCYPELLLPTFFLYMFLIGAWQYRLRPRQPAHADAELSILAVPSSADELEEEFDPIGSAKQVEVVRRRYERLRVFAGRVQNVAGDLATQLERAHSLLSWRDPRATSIFVAFCLLAAVLLYLVPFRVVAIFGGLYALRPRRFRSGLPPLPLNFFKRLPSLADSLL